MGQRATVTDGKKNTRTQLVMLGGVSVVGLAVVIRLVASGPQPAPAASVHRGATALPAPAASNSSAAAPSSASSQGAASLVRVTWPEGVARDPFHSELVFPPAAPKPKVEAPVLPPAPRPVDYVAVARAKLHLKATILGDRPLAMMNGRVYRVGEIVEGFQIVTIETNQITVERGGSRLVVEVQ